jgi:hypothetical protein
MATGSDGGAVDGVVASGVPVADAPQPPPPYDSWEADERLQHIDRLLHFRSNRPARRPAMRQEDPARTRVDAAEKSPRDWHAGHVALSEWRIRRHENGCVGIDRRAAPWGDRLLAVGVWLVLPLGVTALVCGGILLGWSAVDRRPELWSIGMPIAIVGQVALLLALILQLDRIWRNHRRTATKLDDVDRQIHDLRSAAAMLSTTHSSPATAFYAHYSGGASPHVLLTDLKSQLDLLAIQLGNLND